jgi:hypothetical protein
LPASIDRVYSSARAQQQLGWSPQFGFAEVLQQLDALSPEVLPAGFAVAAAHSPVPPLKESCS